MRRPPLPNGGGGRRFAVPGPARSGRVPAPVRRHGGRPSGRPWCRGAGTAGPTTATNTKKAPDTVAPADSPVIDPRAATTAPGAGAPMPWAACPTRQPPDTMPAANCAPSPRS
ncbi:hypothetical protein GCM10010478_54430 [Streptomyces erythrogriseus]|uniref:Uncharacterized protein n=1 Tax=Streptomyces erythrogriseus TaxID=284027 RepID=A0ABN3XBG9_9ACTN